MFEEDDRLLCYPSIVRVLPADLALEIDRRRVAGIRPSVVSGSSSGRRTQGPRFKAAPFLSSLPPPTTWCWRSRARRRVRWCGCWTSMAC